MYDRVLRPPASMNSNFGASVAVSEVLKLCCTVTVVKPCCVTGGVDTARTMKMSF